MTVKGVDNRTETCEDRHMTTAPITQPALKVSILDGRGLSDGTNG